MVDHPAGDARRSTEEIPGGRRSKFVFLNNLTHVGAISRISDVGAYVYVGSVSGFAPWSNVTAN
jgi:hypothetical protein